MPWALQPHIGIAVGDKLHLLLGGRRREQIVLARNRRGLKLIDRSARDLPELAALWFEGARGGFLALLGRYLEARFRRRHFRPVPDLAATTRLVLELIVFWAVHRHWDAHPDRIEESIAKATVIRFVTGALAGKDRS